MPHYRFHFMEGAKVKQDRVGVALANRSDAYTYALATIREIMLSGSHHNGWKGCAIGIEDAPGELTMIVPFPPNVRIR